MGWNPCQGLDFVDIIRAVWQILQRANGANLWYRGLLWRSNLELIDSLITVFADVNGEMLFLKNTHHIVPITSHDFRYAMTLAK